MSTSPQTIPADSCTLAEFSVALAFTAETLQAAADNVLDLLNLTGFAGAHGDSADDMKVALDTHLRTLREFSVKVRTAGGTDVSIERSATSYGAYQAAATKQGDTPCAITVTPTSKAICMEPDRAALEAAHRTIRAAGTVDDTLNHSALGVVLRSVARKKMRDQVDLKRLAANDHD